MSISYRLRASVLIAALMALAWPGCTPGSGADASTNRDVVDAGEGFEIAPGGTTQVLRLPNGQELTFTFPADAAGTRVVLRVVDDATIGRDGDFPILVEMLPHGHVFTTPVRIVASATTTSQVFLTFADASAARMPELLPTTADGTAFEIRHFSYIAIRSVQDYCATGMRTTQAGPSLGCCLNGISTIETCVQTMPCLTTRSIPYCVAPNTNGTVCLVGRPYQLYEFTCAVDGGTPDATPIDAATDSGATDSATDSGAAMDASADTGGGGDSGSGGDAASDIAIPDAGGCPITGVYSLAASGSCGDLDPMAPRQRLDGTGCRTYWEEDAPFAGPHGLQSGAFTYAATGTFTGLVATLGTGSYSCAGTVAGTRIMMTCTSGTDACSLTLNRTGPL